MLFLVDAQIPPALARWLAERGHEASHVVDHGLEASSDREIWHHARNGGLVIISKDEDFAHLANLEPDGPEVVWVRVGNTSRKALLAWFGQLMPELEQGLAAGENVIEVTEG